MPVTIRSFMNRLNRNVPFFGDLSHAHVTAGDSLVGEIQMRAVAPGAKSIVIAASTDAEVDAVTSYG
jgi:hypothetical protein